jgi:hypothetical protein
MIIVPRKERYLQGIIIVHRIKCMTIINKDFSNLDKLHFCMPKVEYPYKKFHDL